ncbi:MAG: hypothetical protein ACJ8EY_01145 [Sphingomicrobium sp.]
MTQTAQAATDPTTDPRIDPQVRSFLTELNKDPSPFWTLPGPQVRAVLTGLQAKTTVDLSGVGISEKTIEQDGPGKCERRSGTKTRKRNEWVRSGGADPPPPLAGAHLFVSRSTCIPLPTQEELPNDPEVDGIVARQRS